MADEQNKPKRRTTKKKKSNPDLLTQVTSKMQELAELRAEEKSLIAELLSLQDQLSQIGIQIKLDILEESVNDSVQPVTPAPGVTRGPTEADEDFTLFDNEDIVKEQRKKGVSPDRRNEADVQKEAFADLPSLDDDQDALKQIGNNLDRAVSAGFARADQLMQADAKQGSGSSGVMGNILKQFGA